MINVGGYRLEGQLGAGSTGTVWKAFREGPIAHPVALKVLRVAGGAVDVQRMRREAAILAELDHPHVVRVIEILEDANGIAIAMQYAPGGSFEMLLAERGRLTPGEVVAVAAPLASALASAHRRGAVHGDVKPANVLFTSDGEPLLSDFGAVRTLGRLTSESFASTPDYVAPELLDGATPDARTDVYSLAVVVYHALTGTPPYTGDTPLAIVRAADLGSYEPLVGRSDVPTALAEVVQGGMARDPQQRFESAEAFGQALRAAMPQEQVRLPGVPTDAAPGDDHWSAEAHDSAGTVLFGPRPPQPGPPPVTATGIKPGWWWAAAAVLVVGVGGLAAFLLTDNGSGDDETTMVNSAERTEPAEETTTTAADEPETTTTEATTTTAVPVTQAPTTTTAAPSGKALTVDGSGDRWSGSCYFAALGTARPVTEAPAAACQSGGQGPSYYTRTAPDGSTENAVCWQQGVSIRDNHLNSSDAWLQLEAGGWMNALYFADWASATDGLPPC